MSGLRYRKISHKELVKIVLSLEEQLTEMQKDFQGICRHFNLDITPWASLIEEGKGK